MLNECKTCEAQFKAKRKEQKYCGKACQTEGQRVPKITRECERDACTNKFEVHSYDPKRYCSSSCAATINNMLQPKRVLTKQCRSCSGLIPSGRTYCTECGVPARRERYIEGWKSGSILGGSSSSLSSIIRDYLLEEAEYACSQCRFDTPHPSDGKTILEIDHVDGNGENHRPENLRVLCPNCHALTGTYRGRNVGRGRKLYYVRVSK